MSLFARRFQNAHGRPDGLPNLRQNSGLNTQATNRDLPATRFRDSRVKCLPALVVCAVGILFLTGCRGLRTKSHAEEYALSSGTLDHSGISGIQGPIQRSLQRHAKPADQSAGIAQLAKSESLADYEAAEKLFDDKRFGEAEKAFKQIAKKYRRNRFALHLFQEADDRSGSYRAEDGGAFLEDVLFMIAECQFHQERYAAAQDSYDRLLNEYPATRYLDETTKRLFVVARTWLGFPETATVNEIQQVGLENSELQVKPPEQEEASWYQTVTQSPVFPNFFDRTRPVFDAEGRALDALRSIWLNDSSGPLADDALMMSATYYLRKGRYYDADQKLTLLREEYPKSPHLEQAFLLGSHVKLMSYQGSAYDSAPLEAARVLKENTLRIFPELRQKGRLQQELSNMEHAKAARDWSRVQFYLRKGKPRAAAIYCREILDNYPNSPFADQARDELKKLGPEVTRGLWNDRLPSTNPADANIQPPRALPAYTEFEPPILVQPDDAPQNGQPDTDPDLSPPGRIQLH